MNVKVTLDVLEQLSTWTASGDLLKATRIGIEVNALRKNESQPDSVKDLARDLVAKWKRDVEAAKGPLSSPQAAGKSHTLPLTKTAAAEQDALPSSSSTVSSGNGGGRTLASDGLVVPKNKDKIRVKCVEMLYGALATASEVAGKIILSKADAIETSVFKDHGDTVDTKYKTRIRSLVSNLKDRGNSELRKSLLSGSLPPSQFSKMTPEEMMSNDLKKKVEEAIKASIQEATTASDNQSETDMFRCGKCKQRKTKYYQMQTRSADEPMTTFVTCINCNNRWKFC